MGFESFRKLPHVCLLALRINQSTFLLTEKKGRDKKSKQKRQAAIHFLVAPPWIAPQLRAQGHVEARRQKVLRLCGYAAKDRLAVRRDAAARRQWLAAGGAGATKALDLLWRPARRTAIKRASNAERRLATPPLPATDPEHSEPGGADVRGRGRSAAGGGSTRGARGAGGEPGGAKGWGGSNPSASYQNSILELPLSS
jgi:hypothetical protein